MKRVEEKQDLKHEDGYPAQRVACESFQIRRATAQDADIIALHRARMLQDMGDVSGDAFESLRIKSRPQLEQWIDSGKYIWSLPTPADRPKAIVGGAASQFQ